MATTTAHDEITLLEEQRCKALTSGDVDALGALVSEDLVHIHGNGHMDGKTDYLYGVANKYKFHSIERGDLKIRVYGDFAVVNGPLQQVVSVNGVDKLNNISAVVTQTWVRDGSTWKQSTCHMGFLSVS